MYNEPCSQLQRKLEHLVSNTEFLEMGVCFSRDGYEIPRDEPVDTTPLKNNRALIIFVVGGPGVGKHTLCRRLATNYGLLPIPLSSMMREEVNKGTAKGLYFKRLMEQGKIVPADIIVQLVLRKMLSDLNAYGYLVIGFPRDKKQVIDH